MKQVTLFSVSESEVIPASKKTLPERLRAIRVVRVHNPRIEYADANVGI